VWSEGDLGELTLFVSLSFAKEREKGWFRDVFDTNSG
jgi:hypothetical protein